MTNRIDLTPEQLDAICDYEESRREYYRIEGKEQFLRDVRHEVIDLVMLETATSNPNEVRVSAYRQVVDLMDKILDEEKSKIEV